MNWWKFKINKMLSIWVKPTNDWRMDANNEWNQCFNEWKGSQNKPIIWRTICAKIVFISYMYSIYGLSQSIVSMVWLNPIDSYFPKLLKLSIIQFQKRPCTFKLLINSMSIWLTNNDQYLLINWVLTLPITYELFAKN